MTFKDKIEWSMILGCGAISTSLILKYFRRKRELLMISDELDLEEAAEKLQETIKANKELLKNTKSESELFERVNKMIKEINFECKRSTINEQLERSRKRTEELAAKMAVG